jgi:hypothetical protein
MRDAMTVVMAALLTTLFNKIQKWLGKESMGECMQCGLPAGREFMVPTNEPLIHPHECSWCSGVLYVPGPMFACKVCSDGSSAKPQAA